MPFTHVMCVPIATCSWGFFFILQVETLSYSKRVATNPCRGHCIKLCFGRGVLYSQHHARHAYLSITIHTGLDTAVATMAIDALGLLTGPRIATTIAGRLITTSIGAGSRENHAPTSRLLVQTEMDTTTRRLEESLPEGPRH